MREIQIVWEKQWKNYVVVHISYCRFKSVPIERVCDGEEYFAKHGNKLHLVNGFRNLFKNKDRLFILS